MQATQRKRRNARTRQNQAAARSPSVFGPVSTIDTAPVSIGNTVQGCSPVITPTADGVRVRGRDFLISANATSTSVTGWCLVGAAPITPECMSASVLKGYCNSYAQYQVHGVALHYITASTTADAGSVMLYVGKDRAAPGLNPSAANLLPFVLSDHCTVITPIWKNASAVYHPSPKWYSTGIGNDEPMCEQSCGEMFVLSKVTENNAPGYILMDYDITFKNMQVNVKSLTFPLTRMKYTEVILHWTANATKDVTIIDADFVSGTLLDGTTVGTPPTGAAIGDVYKVVFTTTLISLVGANANNLIDVKMGANFAALSIVDGYTLYGAITSSFPNMELYPTYQAACIGDNPLRYGFTANPVTANIHAFMSLCGSVEGSLLQANY